MLNSLYALILTDSLHLPTIIGYFNTRPAACQARQSAHAWLKGESQSVEDLKCFSNAAMNILDQCRTAIEKNPAHYVDLRVKPADDLSDPETTPFRVYYETAAGDRYFTIMETVTDLTAPCYIVTWPIIRPSAENEEDACDWSTPNGLTPHGEYDLERRYYY